MHLVTELIEVGSEFWSIGHLLQEHLPSVLKCTNVGTVNFSVSVTGLRFLTIPNYFLRYSVCDVIDRDAFTQLFSFELAQIVFYFYVDVMLNWLDSVPSMVESVFWMM